MSLVNRSCTVSLLGGDARQIGAALALKKRGICVNAWGLGELSEVRCPLDWKDAVKDAEAILLPLPASVDGVHLNAPLSPSAQVRMDLLLEALSGKTVLFPRPSETLLHLAERHGVRCIDYFSSELLQLKNAIPTAEGAIEIAMRELPVTIDGTHMAVIGYGRIGELLSERLIALGAAVTVYARRREVLARAQMHRCEACSLSKEPEGALCEIGRDVRVIFNTVPARIFTEQVTKTLPKGCVFIDLASLPGGIDRAAAEKQGIRCIWATALPGKYAPETAGQIIAETAEEILCEEGLI